jgi:voltage-gated potassium channel
MPILLRLKVFLHKQINDIGWGALLALGIALFACFHAGLNLFEPEGATIAEPKNSWWYFIITATTIGYGDYAAATTGGRICVALFGIVGGTGLFAAVIGKIAAAVMDFTRKGQIGMKSCENLAGHVVLVGWRGKESLRIVESILADPAMSDDVVLLDSEIAECPMPGRIRFVKATGLADPDALVKAGIKTASAALIHAGNDDATLAATVAVESLADEKCHVVACVPNQEQIRLIGMHAKRIECVAPLTADLLARSLRDPGSSRIAGDIYSIFEGQTQFSLLVAEERTWGELSAAMKTKTDALAIAVENEINPPNERKLIPGQRVFYLATDRIEDGAF